MSNKSKIIIAITSIIVLIITGITVNYFIKKEEQEQIEANKPKCVNVETEQQVRYILNMPTEDISIELYTNEVWYVTKAFGYSQSVWTNEDGLYAFGDGSNDVPPPEEYMDEKYLEFALWLYTYQTGEVLAIEEIEKCVTEGNIDKKEEIDAYVDWYYDDSGQNNINAYAGDYHRNFRDLTLVEQQAFVQASDEYKNKTGEDFSALTPAQQEELMQAYIKEHGTNEQ